MDLNNRKMKNHPPVFLFAELYCVFEMWTYMRFVLCRIIALLLYLKIGVMNSYTLSEVLLLVSDCFLHLQSFVMTPRSRC